MKPAIDVCRSQTEMQWTQLSLTSHCLRPYYIPFTHRYKWTYFELLKLPFSKATFGFHCVLHTLIFVRFHYFSALLLFFALLLLFVFLHFFSLFVSRFFHRWWVLFTFQFTHLYTIWLICDVYLICFFYICCFLLVLYFLCVCFFAFSFFLSNENWETNVVMYTEQYSSNGQRWKKNSNEPWFYS